MQPTSPNQKAIKATKVCLIDDHVSLRQMLSFILAMEGRYELVGEASGGMEGLRMCRTAAPEMVVLDLSLPELSGLQLIRILRAEGSRVKILVYTGAMDDELLRQAL